MSVQKVKGSKENEKDENIIEYKIKKLLVIKKSMG